jgi:hypothetical protein
LKKTVSTKAIIAFLLIAAASMSAGFVTRVAQAQATLSIYIKPSTITFSPDTANVGTLFNFSIWCNASGNDLGGADVKLEFNDSIINATRWFNPSSDPNYFYSPVVGSPLPAPPNPGYKHNVVSGLGTVEVAVSNPILPPTAPWGHDGLICIFEFNVTAVPPSGAVLTTSLHINNTKATFLLDTTGAGINGTQLDDGTYTFVPEFPIALILPTFAGLTLIAVAIRKKVSMKPKAKGF